MSTETVRISSQAQDVNPPLSIHNNLERVAAIAGAVASFALAVFAFIGAEYLIAALSTAAGLSLLYSFMQGEGAAAVPPALPLSETPVVAQQTDLNSGANVGSTVQTTLAAQTAAVESTTSPSGQIETSGPALHSDPFISIATATSSVHPTTPLSRATSSTQIATLPAPNSSDETSFLRRRSPDQHSRVITRTPKFDPLPSEMRQSSALVDDGSDDSSDTAPSTITAPTTESKHRRTQSDSAPPPNAFEQYPVLSAATSGSGMPKPVFPESGALIAGVNTNSLAHLLARPDKTEIEPSETSPFRLRDGAIDELDDILSGLSKHLDKSDPRPVRRRAASYDELASPAKRNFQEFDSRPQLEIIEEETSAEVAAGEKGLLTTPTKRKHPLLLALEAQGPVAGTPMVGQVNPASFSEFVKSMNKNIAGLPRSPSNPDLRTMAIFRTTQGTMPIGAYTANMFSARSVKKITAKEVQDKY